MRFFEIKVPRSKCISILNKVGNHLVAVMSISSQTNFSQIADVYIIVKADNIEDVSKLLYRLYGDEFPTSFDCAQISSDIWEDSNVKDIYPNNGCFHFIIKRT